MAGCGAIAAAKENVSTTDVELRNQLDYYTPRCSNLAARIAARDSAARTQPAAAATPPNPTASAPDSTAHSSTKRAGGAGRSAREFSIQVAAYDTRAEAEGHAKRLSARGYTARVVGGARPYRVRVGRYATRERAESTRRQVGGRAIIVDAEPR